MRDGTENGTVLDRIVARRRERVRAEGPGLAAGRRAGSRIPAVRPEELGAPVPFLRPPAVIAEIKRASPSRGVIKGGMNPVEQARLYADQGVKSLSVLTEEDHFGGSLADLTAVKRAFPDLAVLRKDFLLSVEDVEVSWRAGADAVLLIAEVLSADELAGMHRRAEELGMAALVELHDPEDGEKAAGLGPAGQAGQAGQAGPSGPALMGINSRDLRSFRIDLLHPFEIRRQIQCQIRGRIGGRGRSSGEMGRVIFESGIRTAGQAGMLAREGWDGLLIGEAAVRNPEGLGEILAAFAPERGEGRRGGRDTEGFWSRLAVRKAGRSGRPLVKICGLKREEDVRLAAELGADLLGFVLAESPRRLSPAEVRGLCRGLGGQGLGGPPADRPLRVGVVQTGPDAEVPEDIRALVEEGVLDALQFHGKETPEALARIDLPAYRALSLASPEEAEALEAMPFPRTLVDARSGRQRGGTGKRLAPETVEAVSRRGALWLAGGLGPESIGEAVRRWEPELVDASSGLEAAKGKKDPERMRRYFAEINKAGGSHGE